MHRPERWGFVQFSDAPPGTDPFRPDPSLPARDLLMAVYHAQHAYHDAHGHWADALAALPLPPSPLADTLRLTLTPDGFTATAEYLTHGSAPARLSVRADSRLAGET